MALFGTVLHKSISSYVVSCGSSDAKATVEIIDTGAPVAFKHWCGRQNRVGIVEIGLR